jgi:hypothetical protein
VAIYFFNLSVYVRVRPWLIFDYIFFGNRVDESWLSFPPCGLKALAQFTPVLSMMTIMLRASSMPEFRFNKFRECGGGGLTDN